MSDQSFEARLESVLRAKAERAVRPFDAAAIARSAARAGRSPFPRLGPWTPAIVFVLLALGVAGGVGLYAGSLQVPPASPSEVSTQVRAPFRLAAVIGADGWIDGATTWTPAAPGSPADPGELVAGYGGATAALRMPDDSLRLASRLESTQVGQLRLTLYRDGEGCRKGDEGTYAASLDEARLYLRLVAISDPCLARRNALERDWLRTLQYDSAGGRGVVSTQGLALEMTLPAGNWGSIDYPDSFSVSSETTSVTIIRDPVGLADPCHAVSSGIIALRPGAAGFEAYLSTLKWLKVVAEDTSVAGLPARSLRIRADSTAPCPEAISDRAIWRAGAPQGEHTLGGGGRSAIDLTTVTVGASTYLIELDDKATGAPAPDPAGIVASIRFFDATGSPAPQP